MKNSDGELMSGITDKSDVCEFLYLSKDEITKWSKSVARLNVRTNSYTKYFL